MATRSTTAAGSTGTTKVLRTAACASCPWLSLRAAVSPTAASLLSEMPPSIVHLAPSRLASRPTALHCPPPSCSAPPLDARDQRAASADRYPIQAPRRAAQPLLPSVSSGGPRCLLFSGPGGPCALALRLGVPAAPSPRLPTPGLLTFAVLVLCASLLPVLLQSESKAKLSLWDAPAAPACRCLQGRALLQLRPVAAAPALPRAAGRRRWGGGGQLVGPQLAAEYDRHAGGCCVAGERPAAAVCAGH